MKQTTLTEKRFFEWHEDEVSVTLRNRGGSYGGGARYSLSPLPGNHRSLVRHRLQVGAAGTSDAREADSMREAIGVDSYNLSTTGGVAITLRSSRADAEHQPCVLILNSSGGDIAGTLDGSYYKGQGLRQGIEREYIVVLSESDRAIDGE